MSVYIHHILKLKVNGSTVYNLIYSVLEFSTRELANNIHTVCLHDTNYDHSRVPGHAH